MATTTMITDDTVPLPRRRPQQRRWSRFYRNNIISSSGIDYCYFEDNMVLFLLVQVLTVWRILQSGGGGGSSYLEIHHPRQLSSSWCCMAFQQQQQHHHQSAHHRHHQHLFHPDRSRRMKSTDVGGGDGRSDTLGKTNSVLQQQQQQQQDENCSGNTGLETMPCAPWNATTFASTKVWGRQPLLMRGAFTKDLVEKAAAAAFPSWQDMIDLVVVEEFLDDEDLLHPHPEIPSRLIAQMRPGEMDSFELWGFGPFTSRRELNRNLVASEDATSPAATLVVNDVDRWVPELSQWVDDNFSSLIPRWRRDDAQISLANGGGGIGPHVDSYDVFLIQLAGTRTWEVGVDFRLSIDEEYDNLIQSCSENGIRILNMTTILASQDHSPRSTVKIQVQPGDCLYLPPRVTHWGTATSDACMTLSVGCRAPSAADLIARLSEIIAVDDDVGPSLLNTIHRRYSDEVTLHDDDGAQDLQKNPASSFMSPQMKNRMKDLILDAVKQALDDDEKVLDPLVGKIVTAPNRFSGDLFSYPIPLEDIDEECKEELGVWANAETTLEEIFTNGKGQLQRAEGVAFAWSCVDGENSCKTYRLYANGRDPLEMALGNHEEGVRQLMDCITNGSPFDRSFLELIKMDPSNPAIHRFLLELLDEGLVYGNSNENNID